MIGIEIKGEFLDLPADAQTQVERNTPLLLGDEVLGEYTLPLIIPATDKNKRLLGFITILGKVKTEAEIKIDASYYEYGIFKARGTLVAEFVQIDLNNPDYGEISVYFLTAISDFYARANKVMLRDLSMGGDRKIAAFRDHVHDTWEGTSANFDYVFAPVRNDRFITDDPDLEHFDPHETPAYLFMNPIVWTPQEGLQIMVPQSSRNRMVPFIYAAYLLKKCFTHFGFTVSGEILEDPDFNKAFFLNFQSVYWGWWQTGVNWHFIELPEVTINLVNHLPKNYSVTKFLISFANFFGVALIFDVLRKHCTLLPLNKLTELADKKDYTGKVAPSVKIEFEKQKKVYALKLSFDPADGRASNPDLTQFKRLPDIDLPSQLPAAIESQENYIILTRKRNWFYQCVYDADTTSYKWVYLCDNIYSHEPAGANEEITTSITPVNTTEHPWVYLGSGQYQSALFPWVEQEGNWPGKHSQFSNWEMRILYFHGMQVDNANDPVFRYPFASSHNYNSIGQKVGGYSLALNPDNGIVEKYWANWLDQLGAFEVATLSYNITFAEYLTLKWTDLVLIRNVMYLNIQQSPVSPFTGQLPVKLLRMVNKKYSLSPCTASIKDIVVTYNDGDTAEVDFTEAEPGAVRWQYSLDGDYYITISSHPFTIPAETGNHEITIVPLCGTQPNPAGSATKQFTIPVKRVTITLSAVLTEGNDPNNRMILTAVASRAPSNAFEAWSFYFGQCVVNTSTGTETCLGFIPVPGNSGAMQFAVGTSALTAESGETTPGANFGYITSIRIWGINSPTFELVFIKAPGENWVLSAN